MYSFCFKQCIQLESKRAKIKTDKQKSIKRNINKRRIMNIRKHDMVKEQGRIRYDVYIYIRIFRIDNNNKKSF